MSSAAVTAGAYSMGRIVYTCPKPERERKAPQVGAFERPIAEFIGTSCPYCGIKMEAEGSRMVTRDHKIPRVNGGKLHGINRIIVCSSCNVEKDARTLVQFYGYLWIRKQFDRARRVKLVIESDKLNGGE